MIKYKKVENLLKQLKFHPTESAARYFIEQEGKTLKNISIQEGLQIHYYRLTICSDVQIMNILYLVEEDYDHDLKIMKKIFR